LVRRRLTEDERGKTHPSHALTYDPSHDGDPAVLHLAQVQARGESLMRCDCKYDYTLVSGNESELTVMLRRLPGNAVAYATGDAERWFLSASACEAARKEVADAIEQDGASAPYLGLHAVIAALDF
jgi:hypothetical protein